MGDQTEVVLTLAEEAAQRAERKARVEKLEKEENDKREKRIEASSAPTRTVNAEYFEKQRKLQDEAAEQNARNKKAQAERETNRNSQSLKESEARYPYPAVNPQPAADHLMEASHPSTQKLHGYTPVKLKSGITLQPQPEKYPTSDPRHGMSEELIRSFGLNPDATKSAFTTKE